LFGASTSAGATEAARWRSPCVGLAGPGHASSVGTRAVADAFDELVDRLGLVRRWLVDLLQAKRTVWKRDRHGLEFVERNLKS